LLARGEEKEFQDMALDLELVVAARLEEENSWLLPLA
jgi:hypothetical protein